MTAQDPIPMADSFDVAKKYVRRGPEHDGFVEFEFAIGDPALCVELVLPVENFDEFCKTNNVIMLDPIAGDGDWVSRLNEASQHDIDAS